jgi:hypothetical protein
MSKKVWGARYTLGARYLLKNTVYPKKGKKRKKCTFAVYCLFYKIKFDFNLLPAAYLLNVFIVLLLIQ